MRTLNKLFGFLWQMTVPAKLGGVVVPDEEIQFDWKFEFDGLKQLDKIGKDILSKTIWVKVVDELPNGAWATLQDNTIDSVLADWNQLHKFYKAEVRKAYIRGKSDEHIIIKNKLK